MNFESASVRLAKILNENNIIWAYGGSCLLYYLGIAVSPRDLDVVVTLKDIEQAKLILLSQGAVLLEEKINDDNFLTKVFYTLIWDGIEIDFMAVPSIRKGDEIFVIPFDTAGPWKKVIIEGIEIGLCDPQDWVKYYGLMNGRQTRVEQLTNYLKENA